ncbi:hypothetical protein C8N43_2229 [Litoreibacter ponti]|uniref:Flagellar assembly protein FliH n=1 Tax=Litoreibacter ponti TaxID=1510457 RepID=A0A2T6BNB3_9RHOB|nr:hypothetical protein [Litoreibacter ponti]PTX57559.1 hypothetical protein C8N43_2229 [Litoreibacter ponti]
MSKSAFLEDFSNAEVAARKAADAERGVIDAAAKREAFDEGYKCGWKDGVESKETREMELKEELSSALQELNFTYFEARQHAVASMRPVLQSMVDAILPKLGAEALGARVVELMQEVVDRIEPSATLICAPDSVEMLTDLVGQHVKFPIEIKPEPTLTTSQAVLKLDDSQLRIDLEQTIETIQSSIDDFYSFTEEKEASHA